MQPDSYVVRAAVEEDFCAITEIYAHHVLYGTATFETDPPKQANMLERRAAVVAAGLPFLAAQLKAAWWVTRTRMLIAHGRRTGLPLKTLSI